MMTAQLKHVRIIDSHTGGEPTRVVLDGIPDLGQGSIAALSSASVGSRRSANWYSVQPPTTRTHCGGGVIAMRVTDKTGPLVGALSLGDGIGLGWAENARGRLLHLVQLQGGRAALYRIVAPTEWNFHPDGPFAAALRERRFDAAQVNAALGACGPMQVIWSADRDRQDRRCARVRRDAWAGYRAGVRKLDQAAGDCDRLGVVGLDCVLRVYASGPGWRSASAGRAATEFRALAHELARHLTVEVSS